MRRLEINDLLVDIDEKTAIGVTYQTYDIKNPAKPLNKRTNSFTVPATSHNLGILGNPQSIHSTDITVYKKMNCNYWDGNNQILTNSNVTLEEISNNRIKLYIVEKDDIWDQLKKISWNDFSANLIAWLQSEKGLPSESNPIAGDLVDLINGYEVIESAEGIVLSYFVSGAEKEDGVLSQILINNNTISGGHFSVYFKTIFEYLEFAYDVNFGTEGGIFPSNIFDDIVANKMIIPIRELKVVTKLGNSYYELLEDFDLKFTPYKDIRDKKDKKAYDVIIPYIQHLNLIKDEIILNNKKYIALRRFDNLKDIAEVVDFSGKISKIKSFSPKIKDYAQDNYIKFSKIYEEGDSLSNSKTIVSENKNYPQNSDLLVIKAFVNNVIEDDSQFLADLSSEDAYKEVSVMVVTDEVKNTILIGGDFGNKTSAITSNLNNVNMDFFFSRDEGSFCLGSTSAVGSYAASDKLSVKNNNHIILKWKEQGGSLYNIGIFDETNDTLLISASIHANFLEYTFSEDISVSIRIIKIATTTTETFEIIQFSGLVYDVEPTYLIKNLKIAALYDLNSEYNFLEEIVKYPKVYNVEAWLTIADLYNLEFFKQYYFKELGASFFINKISGFNSQSKKPTTLELIKVSEKTPITPPDLNFYTDGVGDAYTDGVGDVYY